MLRSIVYSWILKYRNWPIALALLFSVGTKEEKPARRDKWLKSTKSNHKPAISTCRISEKAGFYKRLYHEQLADFRRTGPSLLKKPCNTWSPQANQLHRHSCLQNVPQGLDSVEDSKMAKIKIDREVCGSMLAAEMISTIRVGMACVQAYIPPEIAHPDLIFPLCSPLNGPYSIENSLYRF